MDAFEATQIVNGEAATNNAEDEVQVGCLKIGSASHAIYKGFTRIGRTPPCRVILEDATVSRVHAEIQADVGNAFVSDLRSSNGTRMKEISLKPFFYYEIKEGGVIYFGQVRAEYTTKVKNSEPDDFVVPETPVVSKYRRGSENLPRNSGIGSIAESSVDESSMYDSDVSLIPGTQEVANKRRRSEEPTRMISETPESSTRDGVARVADIHEMETQNDVEFSCQPGPSKRSRWQRIRRNDLPGDETRAMPLKIVDRSEPKKSPVSDDIFEAETQAMPTKIFNRKVSKKSQNQNDIFEAETQAFPVARVEPDSEKSANDDDIFEAETQAMEISSPKSAKNGSKFNKINIHEAETQAIEISSPKSAKNGSKFNKINIHEAETQAIGISSPKSTQKVSKFSTKNIYDAETQAIEISSPKSAKNGSKFNKINIHEAETQAMEISSPKSTQKVSKFSTKNIYDAETQAMEISSPKSTKKDSKFGTKNIYDAETQAMEISSPKSTQKVSKCGTKNIYDAETQAMEISSPKSTKKDSKFGTKNIYDAETQAMAISSGSRKSVEKETDNIYEMATQVVSVSLRNEEDRLANDTAESSLRSNFSRDRLRLSSTPPGSPDNPDESQNLLEIVETPLLAYENIAEKKSSQEHRRRSENEEAQSLEKKSPRPRPVRIIPESSESETDDESATTRVARRRSKPSHVIEDSSDETDEENIFAASALRKKIPEKSTAAKEEAIGKLEVKRIRGSPLRLRQKPKAASENVLSGEASSGEKSLARTGDSPMETKEETPMKKSNETLRKRLGNSPLSLSREKKGDSTTIDRVEIVRQAKANLFGDWAQENDEPTTKNRDENSRNFEGSPTKNDDSMKNRRDSQSKRFDSPTIIFHNGEDLSIEKDDENSTNEFDDSTSTKSRGETSKKSKNEGTEWENLKKRAETSEESMNKKDISKKSTNDEKSSKISKNQGSNKFENSPEKDDGPLKNRGESSEEKKIARLSLRRARKSDDDSPKKIDEGIGRDSTETERSGDSASRKDSSTVDRGKKAFDENHDNIFEAATQRMNPANCERRTGGESRDLEAKTIVDDDIDIDLLPTQIVDLPSSTPFSRRARVGKSVARREFDGDDLHSAPTQIPRNVESPKNVSGVDDDEKKIVERGEKKRTEKTIDLDDSLAINLGNLLGEEANDENFDDDADETQLMTQNLVDILRPTQSFNETEQRGRKSSPGANETEQRGRKSSPGANETEQRGKKSSPANENLVGQGTFESPLRKRTYAPVTLGFVDGEARERDEFDSPKKSKADENIVQPDQNRKTFEPDASASRPDEDDIFFGLPEVKIAGTFSNPGSPASSIASSLDVVPPFVKVTSGFGRFQRKRPFSNLGSSTSGGAPTSDPESPITPKKSRITRRDAARYRIMDDVPEDSDEDFDYQDLKRMADRLLAAGNSCEAKTERAAEKKTAVVAASTGRSRGKKTPETRASPITKADRAKELPRVSSSLVSDAKSGSSGESRKSSRARKPARKASSTTTRVEAKQQRSSEESQEIEAILGSSTGENLSATTRTSCVKVQLTRLDDSGAKEELGKVGDVFERPKVTRTRRTTSATRKEAAAPLPSPAKRARRTIAETPGIPGNNQIEHKVMFTGIAADGYCKIVEKLGGAVVSEPSKATVLITDKVRRTYKFLCAVAHGMRVVSINWLLESNKASSFLDSDGFTLREPAAEAKYKFNLANSLRIARTKKFLEGYTIVVTPKVNQPEVRELKAMVEAAGGRLLVRPPGPRGWNAKTVIVSREEDYAVAKTYLAKVPKSLNVTVQSTEFILTGILRQEVNLVEHKLDFT